MSTTGDEIGAQGPSTFESLQHEQDDYMRRSEAAAEWLSKLSTRTQNHMRIMQVRCPAGGCLLGQTFRLKLRSGGVRYLFLCSTSSGTRRARFLNWAFSDDWGGPPVWFPAGCRHGEGKLERAWLLDIADMIGNLDNGATLSSLSEGIPDATRLGMTRRIFHPQPEAWNLKRHR